MTTPRIVSASLPNIFTREGAIRILHDHTWTNFAFSHPMYLQRAGSLVKGTIVYASYSLAEPDAPINFIPEGTEIEVGPPTKVTTDYLVDDPGRFTFTTIQLWREASPLELLAIQVEE